MQAQVLDAPVHAVAVDAATQLRAVERELNSVLIECAPLVRCILTGMIGKQHTITIGPPGTAKTLTINEIGKRVEGRRAGTSSMYFYAGNKFATPDDVMGPISFKGLVNEQYTRVLTGRAADSEIVYLDEFFQFSGAMQRSLLGIMNEREYTNGTEKVHVPLLTMLAAANTEPTPDLMMVWDRFMFRVIKQNIAADHRGKLLRLVRDGIPAPTTFLSRAQLQTLMDRVDSVGISDSMLDVLCSIYDALDKAKVQTSDRRRGWLVNTLRAHAVMGGRDEVTESDLAIAPYVLWEESDQFDTVTKIVKAHMQSPLSRTVESLTVQVEQAYRVYTQTLEATNDREVQSKAGSIAFGALKKYKDMLDTAMSENPKDRSIADARELLATIGTMTSAVRAAILGGTSPKGR